LNGTARLNTVQGLHVDEISFREAPHGSSIIRHRVAIAVGSRLGMYEDRVPASAAAAWARSGRARDTKLNREVAINVLLPAVYDVSGNGQLNAPADASTPPITLVVNWLGLLKK